MVLILGILTTVIGFVLILAIGAVMLKLVIELAVRIVLALALAVGAGVIAGITAQLAGGDAPLVALPAFILAFLPALVLVSRWRSAAALPATMRSGLVSRGPSLADLDPYERAWAIARNHAPRGALDNAQAASTRFLEFVDQQGSIDPVLIDYAVMLRRHVPALVEETEQLLATADWRERRTAVAALIEDLQKLGVGASALLGQQGQSARDKLAVRRARLFGQESGF